MIDTRDHNGRFTAAAKATMQRMHAESKTVEEIAAALGETRAVILDQFKPSRSVRYQKPSVAKKAPQPAKRLPPPPVQAGGFIRPSTLAQLMGRR